MVLVTGRSVLPTKPVLHKASVLSFERLELDLTFILWGNTFLLFCSVRGSLAFPEKVALLRENSVRVFYFPELAATC